MEGPEVPLEHLHEHTHHAAEHGGERWIAWVALSTAFLAVFAAITGLLAGARVNEAMMSQIEAADHWSYYQAKGIKAAVLDAKMSLGAAPNAEDQEKAHRYAEEQEDIQKEARASETHAKHNFHQHEIFARGVTMFQIAIAVAAISALTKRKAYWLVRHDSRRGRLRLSRARLSRALTRRSGAGAFAFLLREFFQQLDLNLLHFEEPIVLPPQEVIDLLVQMPDLQLRLQVHLIIVLGA